ncbi:Glycosyltransferase involved in cell wall bisynthesis [Singulisphaera sp. GP187]|uniref:glycosyltransferase family 4 protein n=1 Tax=Singulisphaera sp. GP187 TaxID=1882752 RepID=UPI0009265088|nr:glycosyltransferase family 4 protein [Singulisphaera sp. GP187]SIN91809.1 Glycosyltransferase involved in cell wall bisynthesis [Singulisphaera sp. GP187]
MSTTLAISFTNFGPYHLARLRALALALNADGGRLIAYEVAGTERLYPWVREQGKEPFEWVTLFPNRTLETLAKSACSKAMQEVLQRDRPDVVAAVGYSRPESTAILRWAGRERRPAILMSESQAIDHPRVWWKEAVKRTRVRRFSSALVGGPPHRNYLVDLGMPRDRIVLGYNAVDNDRYARQAERARQSVEKAQGLPRSPYFLAVNRFAPEKNLVRLVRAFARYRSSVPKAEAWDLVLCGDGPSASEVDEAIAASGFADSIHRPGFLQADELSHWYAFASAFVHPSLMEPWGLVVNEAAACGLPLLISDRAGCGETLVPDLPDTTGRRFDPGDVEAMSLCLTWMAALSVAERQAMGRRAREVVAEWGPERFAAGTLEAIGLAVDALNLKRKSVSSSDSSSRGLLSR